MLDTTVELTREEAQEITARIRGAAEELWRLLYEAHEGKAWRSLGYTSWNAYVETEFEYTGSGSYRLLRQAEVTIALETAGGLAHGQVIPRRTADTIKPQLPAAISEVREAVASGTEPQEAISNVVQKYGRPFPTADARELAAEVGEYVPAEDGLMYDGRPLEIAERESEQINHTTEIIRALERLAQSTDDPWQEANNIPAYYRDRVNQAIKPALEWLQQFADDWKAL